MGKMKVASPERAVRKGLREVKAGDLLMVKAHIRRILGLSDASRMQFAWYLDGKMPLDVVKAKQIEAVFNQYGVSNPWGF